MPGSRSTQVTPGTGPLRPGLVWAHARGMFGAGFGRIAGAAFVFFVPPAALYFGVELVRDARADSDGTSRWVLLAVVLVVASAFRLLGEVVFAGFIDLAIGDDYFRGERRTLAEVLRELPWRPLVAVDIIVNVAAAVALAFFFVPGILVYTFFGLVGPVVVQERRRAIDGLRRTFRVTRPYWYLVLVLVVIPIGVEHAVAELVRDAVHEGGLVVVVGVEWLIAVTMLALVGVVEVALATELMARTPDPTVMRAGPSSAMAPPGAGVG